jgi:hypothetical protein
LAGGNLAVALLANTIASVAALGTLIALMSPISGAHFNSAVFTRAGGSRKAIDRQRERVCHRPDRGLLLGHTSRARDVRVAIDPVLRSRTRRTWAMVVRSGRNCAIDPCRTRFAKLK